MHTKLHYKRLSKAFDNQNFCLTASFKAKNLALLALMFGWCFWGFGQIVVETPGTGAYVWTAPCDVTSITVEVWGAGGGGQRANGNPSAGGGGSGGGYIRTIYPVIPGTTYTVFAGTGGTGNSGGDGTASWFDSETSILAVGGRGAGATINTNNTWGLGAIAFNSGNIDTGTNQVNTYGGDGGNAGNNFSGGGGSSGGDTSNNAVGITGGPAPVNGYAGANGRSNNGLANSGNIGAGGAGGRLGGNNNNRLGGAGGRGHVRITYNTNIQLYCAPTFTSAIEPITNVTFAGINNTTSPAVNGTTALESFCDTATVLQGSPTNDISIQGNTDGPFTSFIRVYIDWDQNGVFGNNPNEIYDLGTIFNSTGTDAVILNGNINVPATAAIGLTRMRVMKRFNTYPTGPCQTGAGFGQAEDYSVEVIAPAPCTTPTNQPTTLNLTPTGTTINGSFTDAIPNPDNYLVVISESSTPFTPVNGTTYTAGQIIGAYTIVDTDSNNVFVASGLNPLTTYYIYVYSFNGLCSGGPLYNAVNPLTGNTTTIADDYCEPSSDDPGWTYINTVNFLGTLNDVQNNNSGFSGGYQNWTGLPNAIQAQGEGVNVFYQSNRSSHFKAWVDWNQNGIFEEPGELIYDTGLFSTPSATFGFVIPPTTPPGDYRIRIRNNTYNGGFYDFNSCEDFPNIGLDFWDGEAEDYTFTVIENCNARITSVTDNDNCGPGTVTLLATSNLSGVTFNWYDSETGGTLLFSDTSGSFTTPALTTTTTYYVTAQNGCETLIRVPVVATINPVSDVTFDPPTLEACGEENAITINASGDTEIVYLIDEDFESGSLGMFENDLGYSNGPPYDTDTQWTNQTSTYIPTNTLVWFPAISSGFSTNQFAMSTSDVNPPDAPGPPGTKRVEQFLQLSAPVDATDVTNLSLTFDMYYSVFADFVDVQVNDGGGWATVRTYNSGIGIGTRFAPQTIDLSAYDGANSLSIRIRFMSGWGDGVAVDNIKLFGERPVVPSFTWTSTPPVDAFLDPAFTTPYVAGTPAATVYVRPSLAQLELSTFDISANITLSNGCGISESITITNNSKVWHGDLNGSLDWDDPDNWRPWGVPTASNCVIITDYFNCLIPNNSGPTPPVLYEAEAKSLSIKDGGYLDIRGFNNLTVTEAINMEASATLNIRNGANIVQIDDVPNTGPGAADMFRSTQIRRLDYVYWSTPVANFNVSQVSPNTSTSLIFEWIPTVPGNGAGNYGQWTTASGIMAPGKGYIIRGPNNFTNAIQEYTANFRGRLNNGLVTQNISRGTYTGADYPGAGTTMATAQDDNWNLLGNPYPSAIDATSFTALNNNIDGTIYLWTHGSEIAQANADPFYGDFGYNYTVFDYLAYNTTGSNPPGFNGYIGANQGFFVLMEDIGSTAQTVQFNNSMRVQNQDDQFFRNTQVVDKHRIWLDLLEPSGTVTTTLVGYVPGATNEKDRLYDAFSINNTTQTIYSRIADQNMSIQGRSLPFVDTDVVPLGVIIKQNGVHTIAINQVDGLFAENQDIYIEDLELGIIHNLKEAPYFFTPENTGPINNRFLLRYTNQTLNIHDQELASINIYKFENEVTVTSPNQPIKSVSVHDMLGRIIGNYQNIDDNNFKFQLNHSNGTYIISAELDNGIVKTKKIIF